MTRAAGLAFYTRRFDDLATEVTLLERRLKSGAGDPTSTRQHAEQLLADLPTAAAIGDIAALQRRLTALLGAAEERSEAAAAQKAEARAAAIARKEALAEEAEKIGTESTAWKVGGDRLRDIVEEWKTIRGIDRKTDDALWKRFAAARDAFGKRRGSHFAQLDAERHGARDVKEKLIARAEELSTSSEWRDTADALKRLMGEWKAAGRAGRAEEDALWARFRAAQDAFFARRAAVFAERDAEFAGNLGAREEIIVQAERSTSPTWTPPKPRSAASRSATRTRARSRATPSAGSTTGCAGPRTASARPSTRSGRPSAPTPTRSSPRCGSGWSRPRRSSPGPRRPATPPGSRRPRPTWPSAGRCCRTLRGRGDAMTWGPPPGLCVVARRRPAAEHALRCGRVAARWTAGRVCRPRHRGRFPRRRRDRRRPTGGVERSSRASSRSWSSPSAPPSGSCSARGVTTPRRRPPTRHRARRRAPRRLVPPSPRRPRPA